MPSKFAHVAATLAAAVLVTFAAASASPQSRTLQLEDFTKITTVSDPQISPDGKSIACIVSRINLDQDRSDRELILIDIATGAPHVMTHDRKGVGSPRWSPEGDRLAFEAVDSSAKEPKLQLYVMPMSGGEAKKITDAPEGIEQFAWRPNGQDIAYVTSEGILPFTVTSDEGSGSGLLDAATKLYERRGDQILVRFRETTVFRRDDGHGNKVWKIWHFHASPLAPESEPRPGFGDTAASRGTRGQREVMAPTPPG